KVLRILVLLFLPSFLPCLLLLLLALVSRWKTRLMSSLLSCLTGATSSRRANWGRATFMLLPAAPAAHSFAPPPPPALSPLPPSPSQAPPSEFEKRHGKDYAETDTIVFDLVAVRSFLFSYSRCPPFGLSRSGVQESRGREGERP